MFLSFVFFFQAEDGIRDFCLSRGLGDVYKRQPLNSELLYIFFANYIAYDQPVPINYFITQFKSFVENFSLFNLTAATLNTLIRYELDNQRKNVIELKNIKQFFTQ
eukprot:TRINITY_DN36231_c0_g1_i1.p3 TRINITY_DN36231_c0_g1~~TRINITY_DN36231_c0_g1_i1.p3  ORF type:complete len:106 (-),score=18.44 TRINITY_DN36231_c0_g1_i1:258-575(-)